jgi:hypothetical protein
MMIYVHIFDEQVLNFYLHNFILSCISILMQETAFSGQIHVLSTF